MTPQTSQTSHPDFIIRPATAQDCPLILQFIRDLADYEKLLHEVVADEHSLQTHLFGETPCAHAVIVEYQGQPQAFALYFYNFSTFMGRPGIYLEDLYVRPAMRGKGLGKYLLAYLAKLVVDQGCSRLEWSVLDWNQSAINFYQSLDAKAMDEWTVNRVTGDALVKLAAHF